MRLQREHPLLNVEMLSATRKVSQNRSGVDLEVVVGNLDVSNAQTIFLVQLLPPALRRARSTPGSTACRRRSTTSGSTALSPTWSRRCRSPNSATAPPSFPCPRSSFQATSIFAQLEAVRRGAGIGLLPNFLVVGDPTFLPVLPDDFQRQLPIWAVARSESLRSAPVQAVLETIRTEISDRQDVLAG